jgi:chromosome segregation ATPase
LGALMALLLTYGVYQLRQTDLAVKEQLKTQHEQTVKQLALASQRLEDNDARIAELTANLKVSLERLGFTQTELDRTRQVAAQIRADQQRRVAELTQELQQKASTEALAQLQQQTTSSLGTISGDVSTTKQEVAAVGKDVAATKDEISKMNLKLSEHGTAIAQNSTELAFLRRRGERDYFEFNLAKGGFQQVGDLRLQLKGADVKKQRYNIEYIADDRKLKRDKVNINEPVLVYVGGLKQPYEIVVNQVVKDRVVGYVSAPKMRGEAPGKAVP